MQAIQRLTFIAVVAAFAAGAHSCAAGGSDWISEELAKPVLGADAARSSWRTVFAEVKRADAECDAAWQRMKTREALQQYGKDLRSRMIRAMGGFPSERCSLNARTVAVLKRDGYTVENVLFESWPGVHVSANLYLPDAARFSLPHPCVLISCGHSGAGKLAPYYSRGSEMSARAGIAALVVDPFTQGERVQERGKNPAVNWDEHNRIGSLAVLLGEGFPRFRVWDAMRALDGFAFDLAPFGYATIRIDAPSLRFATRPPDGSAYAYTGLITAPRAGHGEKDGQMYILWGAEMSPDFDHYELWRDGKFLANVTNEVPNGIPYRVARYVDLGLPTHSRHEYCIRKVWKDGRKDPLGEPFWGLTRGREN